MDHRPTLPSHSETYDKKMKSVHDNLLWSKRLFHFIALTVVLNIVLTYGLIFHPPPPSVALCAEFIKARYPELAVPTAANIARSTLLSLLTDMAGGEEEIGKTEIAVSLGNDVVAEEQIEITILAVRSPSELVERNHLQDLNGRFNVAAIYVWPFVQTMAWWNMVAACQDFTDSAPNTINCLWVVITSVITLAVGGVKVAIWYGQVINAYINGRRDNHPNFKALWMNWES